MDDASFHRTAPQRYTSDASLALSETSSVQLGTVTGVWESGSSHIGDEDDGSCFNTSFDNASFGGYSRGNGSHTSKLNEDSLALLIGQLKGQGEAEDAPMATESNGSDDSDDDDESVEDDEIARVLQGLESLTKGHRPATTQYALTDREAEDETSVEHENDDDESDDEDDDEEETDEEEEEDDVDVEEETVYETVNHSEIDIMMQQLIGDNNSSWAEEEEDDEESDDESKVTVNVTAKNIESLARVAENAEKLILASKRNQEKMAEWRVQQRNKVVKKQPKVDATPAATPGDEEEQGYANNDLDSVFTPVDKLVPGDSYGVPWTLDDDGPDQPAKPLEVVIRKPVTKRKAPRKKVAQPAGVRKPTGAKPGPRAPGVRPVVRSPNGTRRPSSTLPPGVRPGARPVVRPGARPVARPGGRPGGPKGVPSAQRRKGPSLALTTVSENDSPPETLKEEPTESASTHKKSDDSSNDVVIPKGYPPYPGFGTKWPWHPYSKDAPAGYKQCYMHHMGEFYFQYLDFLRNRAGTNMDEADAILQRANESKGGGGGSKPAIQPRTSTSQPGKARVNSVVPVSAAVQPRLKDDAKPTHVGKHHPKSKGRKGKIVVRSGAQLEKQEKAKRKTTTVPEQSTPETTDQTCACTIM